MKQFCLFLILVFLIGATDSNAQNLSVKCSQELVVINGKEFYLHSVEKGQTLYSISKAYGITVESILECNKKNTPSLALNEVLKIPRSQQAYMKPHVADVALRSETVTAAPSPVVSEMERRDREMYQHVVKPGETLYGISRMYDIKVRKILRYNKNLEKNSRLSVGDVVWLPMKDITIPREQISVTPVEVEETVVEQPVEEESVEVEEEVIPEDVIGEVAIETPLYSKEDVVKVAICLPLQAEEQVIMGVDTAYLTTGRILDKSAQFIQFYQGALVAVDSLQRSGYKVELRSFDTKSNVMSLTDIVADLNSWQPDLVVGPIYGTAYARVISGLQNKSCPVIYPLSQRGEQFNAMSNFVQVAPSTASEQNALTKYVIEQGKKSHVITMDCFSANKNLLHAVQGGIEQYKIGLLDTLRLVKWNFNSMSIPTLANHLSPTTENVVFVPSRQEAEVGEILSQLNILAEDFPISVVGLPEWEDFSSIEGALFFNLNVSFVTSHYTRKEALETIHFEKQFIQYCNAIPTNLSYRGYDILMYMAPLVAQARRNALIEFTSKPYVGLTENFVLFKDAQGSIHNKGVWLINFNRNSNINVTPLN